MKYIATSHNQQEVYFDTETSHAATHLSDTPELIELLQEIIPKINLEEEYIEFEHDFGKPIGLTDLVINQPNDKMVYAKRKNRDAYNPFNKSQKAQPCHYVSLALQKKASHYELLSAYVGREGTPPFPGEPEATEESITFWNTHSFAFGTQEIQEETLTEICPW